MYGLSQGRNIPYSGIRPSVANVPITPTPGGILFPNVAIGGPQEAQFRRWATQGRQVNANAVSNIDYELPTFRRRDVISRYARRYGTRATIRRGISDITPGLIRLPADALLGGFSGEESATPGYYSRSKSNVAARFNRRYGSGGARAVLGRGVRRFGRGALIGGALAGAGALGLGIFGGPGAQAAQSGSLEAAGSVLSGGFEGAMLGATIGSIVPGIGTAAGAVIGGVIGGVAPLMDKGVRDKMAEFLDSIGQGFRNTWNTFTRGIGDLMNWAGKGLENAFKGLVNGIVGFLNAALSTATAIPRAITTMVQALYESAPGWVKDRMPGAGSFIQSAVDATSYQIPKPFFGGKNFAGPTLALEERMSGRNAMVVNDGEFVIPNNGLATLSNLVGQNLRNREVVTSSGGPTQINFNLTVQTSAFFADAEQIARELKQPVITIIDEAWKEYADVQNVMRSKVS
jgi:hypothetical protein